MSQALVTVGQAGHPRGGGDEARLLAKSVKTHCLPHVRANTCVDSWGGPKVGPRGSLLTRGVYRALRRESGSSCFSLLRRGGQGALCEQDQNRPLKRDQGAA